MVKDSWVIHVNDQISKTKSSDNNTIAEANHWKRRCIYKLPASVTELKTIAYRPKVVSFGPYHRHDEYAKPMEEHKDRALVHFLKRSKINDLQVFFDAMDKVVEDLMAAYESLDPEFQNDRNGFLKIMIRDGCFMIEVLRQCTNGVKDYPANDPIFSDHGKLYVMPYIKRDMFLLENQLPMLVLHKLLQVENALAKEDEKLANKLVYGFLFPKSSTEGPSNSLHVLDLYRRSMIEVEPNAKKPPSHDNYKYMIPKGGDDIIRSAFELDEAGIKIKRSKTRCLKDISFENGVLRLPMIIVDDTTEPLFLNLIAFERFHVGAGNDVTSYVYFMDNIIDDGRDISLLHSKDIIQNAIGSNKAAAKLFNSLSNDVSLDENSDLGSVYRKVNDYCKKRWPKWRANLKHTYFTNPWAFLSVAAAIFLFALTITQTVYAIVDFYQPNN